MQGNKAATSTGQNAQQSAEDKNKRSLGATSVTKIPTERNRSKSN